MKLIFLSRADCQIRWKSNHKDYQRLLHQSLCQKICDGSLSQKSLGKVDWK